MTSTIGAAPIKRVPGKDRAERHLLCLPHAGGGASSFRPWRAHLPADTELLIAQYPGREDRINEPFTTDLEDLADHLVNALLPAMDTPLTVLGHSMGALVGYEMVRQLVNGGAPRPARLIVSSQFAPGCQPPTGIAELDDDTDVLARVEHLTGTTLPVAGPEFTAYTAALLRADFDAIDTYRPLRWPVPVPVHVFGGRDDTTVHPRDLSKWDEVAGAGVTRSLFPGGHFYLRDDPSVIATVVDLMSNDSRTGGMQ